MSNATHDHVREELTSFLLTQWGHPTSAYRFDEMVDEYVARFGGAPLYQVDPDAFLALLQQHEVPVDSRRPCPSWCEQPYGHDFSTIETGTGRKLRDHCLCLGPHVDLTMVEYADAPLFSESIALYVSVDDPGDRTSGEVRQLAAELLNAADELDSVSGGEQWTEDRL